MYLTRLFFIIDRDRRDRSICPVSVYVAITRSIYLRCNRSDNVGFLVVLTKFIVVYTCRAIASCLTIEQLLQFNYFMRSMSKNEPILPRLPLITSDRQDWDGIYLRHDRQPTLEPESLTSAAIDSLKSDRLEIMPQFATSDSKLLEMPRWLLIELKEKQMGSRLYVKSITTALMVHLLRNYCVVKSKIPEYSGGLAKYKLRRAIALINDNLDRDLRLSEIANLCAMSPYHFARMFKLSTGLTPHQYIPSQTKTG